MFSPSRSGVLYTEHAHLASRTALASLWSFESDSGRHSRGTVRANPNGSREYWLERSDPLLNTILPGTGVSLIVNLGDPWAAGRSLATCALLPRVCVVGPVTQGRVLVLGRSVDAVGAAFLPMLTPAAFNTPATELVDRIVPLEDLWSRAEVERLYNSLASLGIPRCVAALRDALMARISVAATCSAVEHVAPRAIMLHAGRLPIGSIAKKHGLSRQQFSRRFRAVAGLPPKQFARITRFQALVHTLLTTDVARWASISSAIGYYDQAHMINEFRGFAGAAPTEFFRPRGDAVDSQKIQLRGRPSQWVRRADDEMGAAS